MGLFDFFKSKKGDDSKSALISKHTNFSYAYINNCFKRFYKEIENFENDEDLFYWYKINYDMSQFAKEAEQIMSTNKKNAQFVVKNKTIVLQRIKKRNQ